MNRSILAAMVVSIAFSFVGAACNDGEPDTSGSGGEAGGSSLGGDSGSGGSGPTCGSSQASCDGICTNLKSDPAHCGHCEIVCGAGEGCSNSECKRFGCATGQVECSSECVSLQTDRRHCGECDKACASGELCSSGECVTSCPEGLLACGDTCIDPQSSRSYCGATDCEGSGSGGFGGGSSGTGMGEACEADELCIDGACQVGCSEGQLVCGGMCIDPQTSPLFCGASDCTVPEGEGVVCESGHACVMGACTTSCPGTQIVCDGLCIDPTTDRGHCGATDCSEASTSGEACEDGEVCSQGSCATSCPGSQIVCDDLCVNPATDRGYCGATDCSEASTSGDVCEDGEVCSMGSCATSCPGDQIVCDGNCIDPDLDSTYCGATDCSAVPTSGVDCGPGEVCVMGSCATSCPPGQQACGAPGSEQCVDPTRDREYCGATDCSSGDNGEACAAGEVCSNSACVTSCPMGQLVCGGNCVNPDTDLDYCGATDCSDDATDGTPCGTGNVCSLGLCSVSCVQGQINCGGKCVDPNTDNQYCGASGDCSGANDGAVCTSGNVCASGACGATCPPGQLECSGACVDPLTSSALCGASDCNGTGGEVCGNGETCVIGECRAFLREWGLGERVDQANPPLTTEGSLAAQSNGNAVVLFRQQLVDTTSDDTSLRPFASRYSASTKTWGTPIQLDTRAYRVRNMQVDVNDSGVAVAVWTRDEPGQSYIVMSRFNGTSWSAAVDVAGTLAETPAVFVDASGRGIIVYSQDVDGNSGTFDSQIFGVVVSATGVVGTPVALSDLSGANFAAYLPRIAGNAAGDAMIVYYSGLAPRNIYAIRHGASTGFQAAASKVTLNGSFVAPFTRASAPQVSMDSAGNAHAVWHQTSTGYSSVAFPANGAIFHAVFNAQAGTWGAATQVTTTDVTVDPRISTNATGTTSITYQVYVYGGTTATVPTNYSVYAQRWSGSAWIAPATIATGLTTAAYPLVVVSGSDDTHIAWTAGSAVRTRRYVALNGLWTGAETLNTNVTGAAQWPIMDAAGGVNVFYGWIQPVTGLNGQHLYVARYD